MLHELQVDLARALLEDGDAVAPRIRGGRLTPEKRLAIYRHNVLANLRGALADIHPVVLAIVGEAFFMHAADRFVRKTPSRSGDLNRFGATWAEFLEDYEHARDLPYLADVARLEWAWHESFHAAEHAPFDLAAFATLPAERHAGLVLRLHPSVRLLASRWPLFRIWEVNQPDYGGEMTVDWESETGGDWLLVHREGVEVALRALSRGQYTFLAALMEKDGTTLEAAAEWALAADAQFDLQGFLISSVQSQVITDFILEMS